MLKIGDICIYSYHDVPENNSLCIVEVVEVKSDNVCAVKFLKVINDDSSNDLFKHLYETKDEMNVTNKYLTKLISAEDLIRQITNSFEEVIGNMVGIMFNENEKPCRVSNCYKSSDEVSCGDKICIDENIEYWKNEINNRLKELF